jgi:HAD superfamily hydrolase (TIGR01509 family)
MSSGRRMTTILWDHDGVLVDTERLYFNATRQVLARVGADLTVELYRQHLLIESRGCWHLAAERGVSEGELDRLRRDRNALYLDLVTKDDVVVPGALELLRSLKPHYRMAIVTSTQRAHFEAIHRRTGLSDLVEFVLAREDYGESKPDPEPYLAAVARMAVAKDDCIVVEDSRRGLVAAHAAGLRCWIVASEMTAGLSFDGADRHFDSLAEVGEALMA